jgi:hypothetical protein
MNATSRFQGTTVMNAKNVSNLRLIQSLQLFKPSTRVIHRRRIRAQLSSFSGSAFRLDRKAQQ